MGKIRGTKLCDCINECRDDPQFNNTTICRMPRTQKISAQSAEGDGAKILGTPFADYQKHTMNSDLSLATLRQANFYRDKEWSKGQTFSLSYRGNELAGETGEACNELKKLEREQMRLAGSRSTIEKLAEELADVIICADLAAMAAGIDLAEAVAKKFNATSEKNGFSTKIERQ